jgi:xanthine dehydrogenase YagR molybdenum-binding subunit
MSEKPINRVDGRLKVTGAARFAADNNPDGLAYGYLVTSTIARGTIETMDVEKAEAAAGVLAVFTADNPLPMPPSQSPVIQVIAEPRRPFQDREINYYGQIIGLVVAETFEQARDAAALIKVTYAAEPPRASFKAVVPEAALPNPYIPFGQPVHVLAEGVSDIDEALATSEIVLNATYDQPAQQHNALEAHSAVAVWEGEKVTVYSATQGPAMHAMDIAAATGIERDQVHVVSPHIGGAFGGKAATWAPPLLAAVAARTVGRPVKVVATRQQVYTVTGHRTEAHQEISLGASRDGTLTALKHDAVSNLIRENPATSSLETYQVPNVSAVLRLVTMDVPKATIMRAPGHSPGSFALECAMDELAIELSLDPIDLRMRNDLTHDLVTRLPCSSKHLDECYRVGAERFGWSRHNPTPRQVVDGDWLVGTGMAAGVLPAEFAQAAASVEFRADGTARVAMANSDLGTGAWTVLTVLGADLLGIPVDRIEPALGDSRLPANPADMPSTMGAVMSSATATISMAVSGASGDAVRALIEHSVGHKDSPLHGMDAGEVRYEKGELTGGGTTVDFARLLTMTQTDGVEGVHTNQRGEASYAFASYAAYFCEVRVNRWTGEPRLSRMTTVVDAGTIVNESTARNQIVGGIVMGLGHALFEEVQLEPGTGRIANANLADYLIPVSADIPDLDVRFLEYPDTNFTSVGARGLGELGCVGSAAAIANAVHNATGRRIRDLPITADKLFE